MGKNISTSVKLLAIKIFLNSHFPGIDNAFRQYFPISLKERVHIPVSFSYSLKEQEVIHGAEFRT